MKQHLTKAAENEAQKKSDAMEPAPVRAAPKVGPEVKLGDLGKTVNQVKAGVGDTAKSAQASARAAEKVTKAKVAKSKADQAQHKAQRRAATEVHEKTRTALNDAATQKTQEAKVKKDLEVRRRRRRRKNVEQ